MNSKSRLADMKIPMQLRRSALAAAFAIVAASTWFATRSEGTSPGLSGTEAQIARLQDASPAPPSGTIAPMGVSRLIRAVPFRLNEPYTHWYRSDRPEVAEGWLVVIAVSPDLVAPTNDFQPVLYAELPDGTQTMERINQGHIDGVSVAFLPGDVDEPNGLRGTKIWFGAPELPERLTASMIAAEAKRIDRLDVFQVSEDALRSAETSTDTLTLADRTALEETAAALIIEYAPGERELAEAFLIETD